VLIINSMTKSSESFNFDLEAMRSSRLIIDNFDWTVRPGFSIFYGF